jgi:hypothetical protein
VELALGWFSGAYKETSDPVRRVCIVAASELNELASALLYFHSGFTQSEYLLSVPAPQTEEPSHYNLNSFLVRREGEARV